MHVLISGVLPLGPTDIVPSVVTGPLNQSVDEGTNLGFFCEVKGSPEPSVSWFLNDDDFSLQSTARISITQTGLTSRLTISNATLNDKGMYKCVATSKIGTASEEAELKVNSKFFVVERSQP